MVNEKERRYNEFKKSLKKSSDFRKACGNTFKNKAVISYNYRVFGYKSDWKELLDLLQYAEQKEDNLYNEYICDDHMVKPYIDIEWYDHEYPQLVQEDDEYYSTIILRDIKKSIKQLFLKEWEVQLDNRDIKIKQCHRMKYNSGMKRSYHLVVSPESVSYVFNDNKECIHFANKLKGYTKFPEIIDFSVYSTFRNLRMLGHCKDDERNHPFKVYNSGENQLSNEDRLHYFVTFVNRVYYLLRVNEEDIKDPFIPNRLNREVDDDIISFVTQKVKKYHPTAYFSHVDERNFIQFNYLDRKEPCFFSKLIHDNVGFYAFLTDDGRIKVGCYSVRCKDFRNKKNKGIGNIHENDNDDKDNYLAVTLEDDKVKYLIPPDKTKELVYKGNLGLAEMFDIIYLGTNKRIKWINSEKANGQIYFWNGNVWQEDNYMHIHKLISITLPTILDGLHRVIDGEEEDEDTVSDTESITPKESMSQVESVNTVSEEDKELLKIIRATISSLRNGTINANILKFIRSSANDLYFDKIKDIHPERLSVLNGMVDLKTNSIEPAKPLDNITKTLELEYLDNEFGKDTETYREWDRFIKDITRNKDGTESLEHYNYLRWIFGYSIQGVPRCKKFFIFWGPEGYNGKSILLNTISDVLEDYCVTMDKSVVMETRQKTGGSHSTEMVRLENCRIGILSDTKENCCIDDGQIKQLTSITDKISVREIYGKQKEIKPTFVPIIATNYKIRVNLQDPSMYERLVLFPFWIRFLDNPTEEHHRKNDPNLSEKFTTEAYKKSILCWILDCSKDYYYKNKSIKLPQSLVDVKNEYRRDMNIYLEFVDSYFIIMPENTNLSEKMDNWVRKSDVSEMFITFCTENGIKYNLRKSQKELDKILISKKKDGKEIYIGLIKKE